MTIFNAFILLGFCASLALMWGGSWNDQFIDWSEDWLERHKSMWARRDWLVIGYHVFAFWFATSPIGAKMILLVLSAAIHFFVFVQAYGSFENARMTHASDYANEIVVKNTQKPHWLRWRTWQIVPGVLYGVTAIIFFTVLTN